MSEPEEQGQAVSEDRFRSEDCENGKHDECEKSPMIGICGCECHDDLDELDAELYGN